MSAVIGHSKQQSNLSHVWAKPRNVTVIQLLCISCRDWTILYKQLEHALTEIRKQEHNRDPKIFQCDRREEKTRQTVMPCEVYSDRNEREQTLVDFRAEHKLVITSTFFLLHNSHRYTWRSPNGTTRTQIDYILINKQCKQSVSKSQYVSQCGLRLCSLFGDADDDTGVLKSDKSTSRWYWTLKRSEDLLRSTRDRRHCTALTHPCFQPSGATMANGMTWMNTHCFHYV